MLAITWWSRYPRCAPELDLARLVTLGLVLCAVVLGQRRGQLLLALLVPLMGFAANVLRVVVSTHMAVWSAAGSSSTSVMTWLAMAALPPPTSSWPWWRGDWPGRSDSGGEPEQSDAAHHSAASATIQGRVARKACCGIERHRPAHHSGDVGGSALAAAISIDESAVAVLAGMNERAAGSTAAPPTCRRATSDRRGAKPAASASTTMSEAPPRATSSTYCGATVSRQKTTRRGARRQTQHGRLSTRAEAASASTPGALVGERSRPSAGAVAGIGVGAGRRGAAAHEQAAPAWRRSFARKSA